MDHAGLSAIPRPLPDFMWPVELRVGGSCVIRVEARWMEVDSGRDRCHSPLFQRQDTGEWTDADVGFDFIPDDRDEPDGPGTSKPRISGTAMDAFRDAWLADYGGAFVELRLAAPDGGACILLAFQTGREPRGHGSQYAYLGGIGSADGAIARAWSEARELANLTATAGPAARSVPRI